MRMILTLMVLLLSECAAFSTTNLIPSDIDQYRIEGFQSLYNLNYTAAKASFEKMIHQEPRHPAGYIYVGSTIWLEHLARLRRLQTQLYNRGNAFFRQSGDSTDPEVEKQFYSHLNKAMVYAEARLRANEKDPSGLYFLGTAHAAIAGYEATVKRAFMSSLKNGSKAVDLHKKLLKIDPGIRDANLTVGMYNYVLGTLPIGVKILMMIGGARGSKTEGLKMLEKTRAEGFLAKDEAAVILVVLYDREKQWDKSLQILQEMGKHYPENYVFELETAEMLSKLQQYSKAAEIFERLLQNSPAMTLLPDLIHYQYADSLFVSQNWAQAHHHYVEARRSYSKTPVAMITMTHLRAGQCLNALGQDNEAKIEYSFVLKQPDFQDSHTTAKKYLKAPYRPQ